MKLTILATIGTFDIELHYSDNECESAENVAAIVNNLIAHNPEIKPRPRFQRNEAKTGHGTVKVTRADKTKTGKDICIATVTMDDGGEQECSYLPPMKTWKAGERVNVVKGNYGAEMKEIDDNAEPPF